MAQRVSSPPSLVASPEQPLIGIVLEEDGRQMVHYFAGEAAADAAVADQTRAGALAAIDS